MINLNNVVSSWLQQRQQILVTLNKLAGVLPYETTEKKPCLDNFFENLIDYACAGHLQIFSLLHQNDIANVSLIKNILKQINASTLQITELNTKYDTYRNISAPDVERLFEQFASRIELEDQLITLKNQSNQTKIYIN